MTPKDKIECLLTSVLVMVQIDKDTTQPLTLEIRKLKLLQLFEPEQSVLILLTMIEVCLTKIRCIRLKKNDR